MILDWPPDPGASLFTIASTAILPHSGQRSISAIPSEMPSQPQHTNVVKYASDGTSVASVGTARHSDDGSTIHFYNRTPQASPLSTSSITVDDSGRPTTATADVCDRAHFGLRHTLNLDYGGLNWTKGNRPHSGALKINSFDAKTSRTHHVACVYAREKLHSAAIRHLKQGNHLGSTHLDFSNTVRRGARLLSGQVHITHHRNDHSLLAKSVLNLSDAGVPTNLQTDKYEQDGTTLELRSMWDYSDVVFNTRRKLHSGNLVLTNTDAQGSPRSTVTFTYESGQVKTMLVDRPTGSKHFEYGIKSESSSSTTENIPSELAQPETSDDEEPAVVEFNRDDETLEKRTETWSKVEWSDDGSVQRTYPVHGLTTFYAMDGTTVIERKEFNCAHAKIGDDTGDIDGVVEVISSSADGQKISRSQLHY